MSTEVDPAAFAKTIADTPDEQLEQGMASENRGIVLQGIFEQMGEHFDADGAKGTDAIVDWKILDRPDGGYDHYEVVLENGTCTATDSPSQTARVTFKVPPVEFLRLVSGNVTGPALFMTGKLKIEGDLMFAARVQGFFTVPTAS